MAFLVPDKIRTEKIANTSITIKEKITPDGARATKDIASYVKKGQLVKPNQKLNNGSGKPKGITVHNTSEIKAATGTNPAEQYARATYPNGNMNGAAVHYWVWKTEIWQQLSDTERGWHAADGSNRRTDHRGGQTGGNLDTIAIECIGSDPVSEDTLAKLVAVLCQKYNLNPSFDVYTHNYWMYGVDKMVPGARKNCPLYILDHWTDFLNKVKSYVRHVKSPYRSEVQKKTGLQDNTMEYLDGYEWAESLYEKLAKAMK
jgi:N-acetylmuramoyl-L-alanine amidase CwlA